MLPQYTQSTVQYLWGTLASTTSVHTVHPTVPVRYHSICCLSTQEANEFKENYAMDRDNHHSVNYSTKSEKMVNHKSDEKSEVEEVDVSFTGKPVNALDAPVVKSTGTAEEEDSAMLRRCSSESMDARLRRSTSSLSLRQPSGSPSGAAGRHSVSSGGARLHRIGSLSTNNLQAGFAPSNKLMKGLMPANYTNKIPLSERISNSLGYNNYGLSKFLAPVHHNTNLNNIHPNQRILNLLQPSVNLSTLSQNTLLPINISTARNIEGSGSLRPIGNALDTLSNTLSRGDQLTTKFRANSVNADEFIQDEINERKGMSLHSASSEESDAQDASPTSSTSLDSLTQRLNYRKFNKNISTGKTSLSLLELHAAAAQEGEYFARKFSDNGFPPSRVDLMSAFDDLDPSNFVDHIGHIENNAQLVNIKNDLISGGCLNSTRKISSLSSPFSLKSPTAPLDPVRPPGDPRRQNLATSVRNVISRRQGAAGGALLDAVRNCRVRHVQLLLAAGMDPNRKDEYGQFMQ